MITLDTSGFWAVTNTSDPHHPAALSVLEADPGPWIIPAGILSEIAWIVEGRSRAGRKTLYDFLTDLTSGVFTLDCGDEDVPRISQLLIRYEDLGLDLPDAAVISCAERNGGRVLTTDARHFHVVARGESSIDPLPE